MGNLPKLTYSARKWIDYSLLEIFIVLLKGYTGLWLLIFIKPKMADITTFMVRKTPLIKAPRNLNIKLINSVRRELES